MTRKTAVNSLYVAAGRERAIVENYRKTSWPGVKFSLERWIADHGGDARQAEIAKQRFWCARTNQEVATIAANVRQLLTLVRRRTQ